MAVGRASERSSGARAGSPGASDPAASDVSGHLAHVAAISGAPPDPADDGTDPDDATDPDEVVEAADGRTRLIDTAEELLDRHGLDGVSLRAVAAASGHRNPSAVHYHFGDREQLLLAVFDRRHEPIEARRAAMLDELDARPDASPRDVVAAAVLPLAEQLQSVGGRRFLRLLLQGSVHPSFYQRTALGSSPSLVRTAGRLLPNVAHLPEDQRIHRLRVAMGLALYALADQARLVDTEHPPRPVIDHDTFCSGLIDATLGAICA